MEVQAESSRGSGIKDDPDLTGHLGRFRRHRIIIRPLWILQMGAVDAIAMDEVVARFRSSRDRLISSYWMRRLPQKTMRLASRRNDTLKDQVQEQLEALAADGTLAKISEKWFDKDIGTTIGKIETGEDHDFNKDFFTAGRRHVDQHQIFL